MVASPSMPRNAPPPRRQCTASLVESWRAETMVFGLARQVFASNVLFN